MNLVYIASELEKNRSVFQGLFTGLSPEEYLWRPLPQKWCLLEILCHLYDEEREDFRARVRHVLERPEQPLSPIRPVEWVSERRYVDQDYDKVLRGFLKERDHSLEWLRSLEDPRWDNVHKHPKLGRMTAGRFLVNWLAHDYLHIRQVVRLKYNFLKQASGESLDYAGTW